MADEKEAGIILEMAVGRDARISLESTNINPGRHEECISRVEQSPFPGISAISELLHCGIDSHSECVGDGRSQMTEDS